MVELKMRLRSSKSSQSDRTSQPLKGYLKKYHHQLLKPFLFYASSTLSLVVALAVSPVRAEEIFPALDDSTSNIKTFESNPAFEREFVHSTKTLKQAASLLLKPFAELSIESSNFRFVEPAFLIDPIAQADAPPLQPSESQPSVPFSEPTSSETSSEILSDRWQFSVEPYFFVPLNVEVNSTVAGRSASINLGLGDILSFDRAFDAGLRVEARKNRWGIIFDGFYIFAKNSGNLGVTFPQGSLQPFGINFPVRTSADASLSVRQGSIDLAASYRVVDTSLGNSVRSSNPFPRLIVDPVLGLRINILSQKLEVDDIRLNNISIGNLPLPTSLPVNQDFSFSRTFVEPLIGAQIRLDLSNRWALGVRGDVSGFGINADRNLTWNLLASTQYHLSPTTSLQLGYRFNSFDFEDGSGLRRARVNLRQNGLMLGVIFRF